MSAIRETHQQENEAGQYQKSARDVQNGEPVRSTRFQYRLRDLRRIVVDPNGRILRVSLSHSLHLTQRERPAIGRNRKGGKLGSINAVLVTNLHLMSPHRDGTRCRVDIPHAGEDYFALRRGPRPGFPRFVSGNDRVNDDHGADQTQDDADDTLIRDVHCTPTVMRRLAVSTRIWSAYAQAP